MRLIIRAHWPVATAIGSQERTQFVVVVTDSRLLFSEEARNGLELELIFGVFGPS